MITLLKEPLKGGPLLPAKQTNPEFHEKVVSYTVFMRLS